MIISPAMPLGSMPLGAAPLGSTPGEIFTEAKPSIVAEFYGWNKKVFVPAAEKLYDEDDDLMCILYSFLMGVS